VTCGGEQPCSSRGVKVEMGRSALLGLAFCAGNEGAGIAHSRGGAVLN
jgi:hypothetical protein